MLIVPLIANIAILCALESVAADPAPAPPPVVAAAPKSEILGLWKGTSTCTKTDEYEFCRDETVVYNFVDVADQPATVSLKAARIVDEFVQPSYALYFTYRPDKGSWTSEFERPGHRGVWAFVIEGDKLTGTATLLPSMKVVRNVVAKRTTKERVLEN